jgi:hypothetical protein
MREQPPMSQHGSHTALERMLDRWIEGDPDAAERWIQSQLARIALRKRLALQRQSDELRAFKIAALREKP